MSSDYQSLNDAAARPVAVVSHSRSGGGSGSVAPAPAPASPGAYGRVHAQSVDHGELAFGKQFDAQPGGHALPKHLTRQDVIESCKHFRKLKPISGSRIKFNLLWNLVIWSFCSLPLWLPLCAGCTRSFFAVSGVLLFFNLVWMLAVAFTAYYVWFLYKGMEVDYKAKYAPETPLYHIIILTIYKDDMEIVMRTLESIAKQTEAKRICMVLGWEGRTPDREERTRMIREAFGDSFYQLLFSCHPYQLPHEIASKAANANWALRYAVRHLFERVGHSNTDHFTVSTCDSDTLYHPRYFESLGADYLSMLHAKHPETHRTIWQAPLFYNWALDKSSFVTRITGLLRTTMTMGCLIPYAVNPMSCFSFSLELAIRGAYWHPQIFMDDVGFLLTMQIGAQDRINMRCLPVPVLSGPTSGATWADDVWEWYVQVRRWAIGTADNFHFMMVKMRCLPIVGAITFTCGYFLYYGIILCSGPLFTLNACMFQFVCPDDSAAQWSSGVNFLADWSLFGAQLTPNRMLMFLTLLPSVWYGVMFILDAVWCKYILHVQEDISFPRNMAHWLLVAPAMLLYSLTQLHGYNVLAFKGKIGACIHQLAGKATLGGAAGMAHGGSEANSKNQALLSPAQRAAAAVDQDDGAAERMADDVFQAESLGAAEGGVGSLRAAVKDAQSNGF